MYKFIFCLLILFLNQSAYCAHRYPEREYQEYWCNKEGGIVEFRNQDGTRVDCLTENYAVEFDFAEKWAESIGQALYYGLTTGKKSGVVLISENGEKDLPHIQRAQILSRKYKITLWIINNFQL